MNNLLQLLEHRSQVAFHAKKKFRKVFLEMKNLRAVEAETEVHAHEHHVRETRAALVIQSHHATAVIQGDHVTPAMKALQEKLVILDGLLTQDLLVKLEIHVADVTHAIHEVLVTHAIHEVLVTHAIHEVLVTHATPEVLVTHARLPVIRDELVTHAIPVLLVVVAQQVARVTLVLLATLVTRVRLEVLDRLVVHETPGNQVVPAILADFVKSEMTPRVELQRLREFQRSDQVGHALSANHNLSN
jgi:hypothetical protein